MRVFFQAFGKVGKFAAALEVSPATINGWSNQGYIPGDKAVQIAAMTLVPAMDVAILCNQDRQPKRFTYPPNALARFIAARDGKISIEDLTEEFNVTRIRVQNTLRMHAGDWSCCATLCRIIGREG